MQSQPTPGWQPGCGPRCSQVRSNALLDGISSLRARGWLRLRPKAAPTENDDENTEDTQCCPGGPGPEGRAQPGKQGLRRNTTAARARIVNRNGPENDERSRDDAQQCANVDWRGRCHLT